MKEMTEMEFRLSAIRELLVIGALKIALVILTFAFATAITGLLRSYAAEADGWMREKSETVSRNIRDLYR
jgi:hypothetical protein